MLIILDVINNRREKVYCFVYLEVTAIFSLYSAGARGGKCDPFISFSTIFIFERCLVSGFY